MVPEWGQKILGDHGQDECRTLWKARCDLGTETVIWRPIFFQLRCFVALLPIELDLVLSQAIGSICTLRSGPPTLLPSYPPTRKRSWGPGAKYAGNTVAKPTVYLYKFYSIKIKTPQHGHSNSVCFGNLSQRKSIYSKIARNTSVDSSGFFNDFFFPWPSCHFAEPTRVHDLHDKILRISQASWPMLPPIHGYSM